MRPLDPSRAPPKHWSFVITCFEPVTRVSGGIGTYTRLLLDRLGRSKVGNVLFITASRNRPKAPNDGSPDVTTLFIDEHVRFGPDSPLNNMADPYRHFGFGAMTALMELEKKGHTFGYVEIPDFAAEGYFLLKARRFGMLNVGRVGVRLHSPLLMLHEDNRTMPMCDPNAFRFHSEERFVYEHADDVLYGGDAMLERVIGLLPPALGSAVRKKSRKIPHPWPASMTRKSKVEAVKVPKLGYVGRLEMRKGVDLVIRALVRLMSKSDVRFELHCFGRDTNTWRQGSFKDYLLSLIPDHLRPFFVFHDYVEQKTLWKEKLPEMSAFVFPSRFENYPNVLLEVLEFGRPVLVAEHGCMPEMGRRFPFVTAINPLDEEAFAHALGEMSKNTERWPGVQRLYEDVRDDLMELLDAGYADLAKTKAATPKAKAAKQPKISFVVAHHNHATWLDSLFRSIHTQRAEGDEIIVVDDGSNRMNREEAQRITAAWGERFIARPVAGGPSVARNEGIKAAKNELIYIVDSDDELAPKTVSVLRNALASHPKLGAVIGFFWAFGDEHHAWAAYDPVVENILIENSTHCGLLIRRSVLKKLGGYSEAQRLHYEDWELNMRLALAGVPVEVVPLVSYRYRVNKSKGRNSVNNQLMGYSYEQAVENALASIDGSQVDWTRFSRMVRMLLARPSWQPPSPPPPLRHVIVDRLNLALKPTPLHSPIKKMAAWTVDYRT